MGKLRSCVKHACYKDGKKVKKNIDVGESCPEGSIDRCSSFESNS